MPVDSNVQTYTYVKTVYLETSSMSKLLEFPLSPPVYRFLFPVTSIFLFLKVGPSKRVVVDIRTWTYPTPSLF